MKKCHFPKFKMLISSKIVDQAKTKFLYWNEKIRENTHSIIISYWDELDFSQSEAIIFSKKKS